jgi:hypothetical protein
MVGSVSALAGGVRGGIVGKGSGTEGKKAQLKAMIPQFPKQEVKPTSVSELATSQGEVAPSTVTAGSRQ